MSQFSRQDYIWLAAAWRRLFDATNHATDRMVLSSALNLFADLLADQSPGFDKARFLAAATTSDSSSEAPPNVSTPGGHCNG
jgi:hypothetical protein